MEVRPKRNKAFICDECGTEINTKKEDYKKIIIVSFIDGRKFRNKFCSIGCYDKWKLMNKKPNLSQAPLEVEINKVTEEEREEYKEEEEPRKQDYDNKKDAKDVTYENSSEVKYEKKKGKKEHTETEIISMLENKDIAPVRDPELYGKKRFIKKKEGYEAVNKLKSFIDNINLLKYLYRKKDEDYKK